MKKILFEQGTPVPLRTSLAEYEIETVFERGWSIFSNGDLLDLAEQNGYDILITRDQNLKHQQNLADRQLAIFVLLSTSWPRIQQRANVLQPKFLGQNGHYNYWMWNSISYNFNDSEALLFYFQRQRFTLNSCNFIT